MLLLQLLRLSNSQKKQIQQKKAEAAEKALTDYLRSNSGAANASEATYLLGQAQLVQKQVDDAIRTFSGLTSRYRGTESAAMALAQLATLYGARNNPGAAQQQREELRKTYPKSPTTLRIWLPIADRLYNENKYAEALAIYQDLSLDGESAVRQEIAQAFVESRGNPVKLLQVANEALAKNKSELASPIYEQLAKLPPAMPEMAEIETRLGWCLYLKGEKENLARAKRYWSGVVSRTTPANPWHAESRWHLVQLAAGPENNWRKAVSLCEEIAAEQEAGTFAQEQAMFARAWLLLVQEQWKPAVKAFDELAAAYPEKVKHPPIQRYREQALLGVQQGKGIQ